MNNFFKAVTLVLILAGTASAELSVEKQIENFSNREQREIITGKTLDEWLEDYGERTSFNRDEWEKERKKQIDFEKKEQRKKYPKYSKKLIDISSIALANCSMYDRFKYEKGGTNVLEVSEQKEEIIKYLSFLKNECNQTKKEWREYRKRGGK